MTLGLQTKLIYSHYLLSKGSFTPACESSPKRHFFNLAAKVLMRFVMVAWSFVCGVSCTVYVLTFTQFLGVTMYFETLNHVPSIFESPGNWMEYVLKTFY